MNDLEAALAPCGGAEGLVSLAAKEPAAAARAALDAARILAQRRAAVGLRLMKDESTAHPGVLLAAAKHPRVAYLRHRKTLRPTPPAYRIETTPLHELVTSDADVLAYCEAHGFQHWIWVECLRARQARGEIDGLEAHRLGATPLALDEATETIATTVKQVLNRTMGWLPLDDLVFVTTRHLAMFMDDTVAPLERRADLESPAVCMDLLERLVVVNPAHEYAYGTFTAVDSRLGAFLIRRLGASAHVPACDLLCALACVPTAYSAVKGDAVAALRAIGPAAVAPMMRSLLAAVDEEIVPWDAYHPTLFAGSMLQAILAVDSEDPFERLAPFFAPERLAKGAGARIANDVLQVAAGSVGPHAHAVVRLLHANAPPRVALREDPRWLDRLVALLGNARLRPTAKWILKDVEKGALAAAVARVVGPAKAPPRAKPPEPAVADAADDRARAAMRELRETLEAALAKSKRAKYMPTAKGKALASAPAPGDASALLADLEKATKMRVPSTLRAFYEIVGALDFTPSREPPPAGWEAFANAPPLVVQPLKAALRELKQRIRGNAGVPHPLRDSVSLAIAAEGPRAAADVWAEDPLLEGVATEGTTFLAWLRERVAELELP